jgi:hypothetical protein
MNTLEPIVVRAQIQIIVTDNAKVATQVFNKISMMDISLIELAKKIEFLNHSIDSLNINELDSLHMKIDAIAELFAAYPEWIPANLLQESTGLTADSIRKQLKNPKLFEPEVEYKQIGRLWYVHKSAIYKIRRQK